MISILIIDDEETARTVVKNIVLRYCSTAEVVGEADCIEAGIEQIKNLKPDLLLLDVELSDGTGFDLLQRIDEHEFKVIFVTAFNQYAIQAIKFCALDYLLKPVAKK